MSEWIHVPVCPMGKPRMTQRDRWKKRPVVLRYREQFCDEVRKHLQTLPNAFEVVFVLPMPKSWSVRKKAVKRHTEHDAKPDVDNVLKALADAVMEDDSKIWDVHAQKIWGDEGWFVIREIS